jgi:hypothetical protein
MEHLLDEAVAVEQETMDSASSWLETLASRCQVKGFVDLWSVSALIRLSDDAHCASVGFSHANTKFLLDQHPSVQGNVPVQMEVHLLYIHLYIYFIFYVFCVISQCYNSTCGFWSCDVM